MTGDLTIEETIADRDPGPTTAVEIVSVPAVRQVASRLPDLVAFSGSGLAQFTPAGAKFVREMFCPDATDIELCYFAAVCNDLGLDPRLDEIYAIKRWNNVLRRKVLKPQIGIAGKLKHALESGDYEGLTQTEWCGSDGKWVDVWLDETTPPSAARVGVHRRGFREPVMGVALWREYAVTNKEGELTGKWVQGEMPSHMLGKCALNQAIDRAFPRVAAAAQRVEDQAQAELETAS